MSKKRYAAEEIIHKLREAKVLPAQGRRIVRSCKQPGITDQIDFDRTTVGFQYFFNPRVRGAVNYEVRSGNAPNFGPGAGPNAQVDGIGDVLAVQLTGIWSQ